MKEKIKAHFKIVLNFSFDDVYYEKPFLGYFFTNQKY